jgi:hypothetical protein
MPNLLPKPALEVVISVRWEGGDRTFHITLLYEDILASTPEDTLLATSIQKKVKVSFEHWRKLEVQLRHVWNNGESQIIYNHSSTEEHEKKQEYVIQMLSYWQQLACFQQQDIRMMLFLDIDKEGVDMLPVRPKLLSLNQGCCKTSCDKDTSGVSNLSPERTLLIPKEFDEDIEDCESQKTFKTTFYSYTTTGTEEADETQEEPETQILFDRTQGTWNKLIFTRVSS